MGFNSAFKGLNIHHFENKKEKNTKSDLPSSQIENTKGRQIFIACYLNIMNYGSGVGVVTK